MDLRTERTLKVYEQQAEAYLDQWERRRYRRPLLLHKLLLELPRNAKILDLGCGPGQDLRYLAKRRFRAVGLDATEAFLRWAQHKKPVSPLVMGDIRALPFYPRSFDAVWAAASLIHLSKTETRQSLKALRGLVRPGGWIAATVIHGKASGFLEKGWLPGRYVSRWTKDELRRVVRLAGWSVIGLECVSHRERKGRWLNLLAYRQR